VIDRNLCAKNTDIIKLGTEGIRRSRVAMKFKKSIRNLTLSNPIFLPPAYSPALVYFGRERGWWITCNYPTVLKEKNRNRVQPALSVG
jgi:hypothetical protein